jgi:hypothetical protein
VSRSRGEAREGERGQILVLFTLAIVAIIAVVGLVLDGGGAFAQRRFEQNAADMAAVAGANAYMNTNSTVAARTAAATAAAHAAAQRNGNYLNGVDDAAVAVAVNLLSAGAEVRVDITDAHNNTFSRIVGQNQWSVSVTAAAKAGTIDTAGGAAPWIMSINAFNADGTPKYGPGNPQNFGETNGDYPTSELDIAWTDYNGSDNVNTSEVSGIIDGINVVTATIQFDQYIGQHNQGNHTALYGDVNQYLAGQDVPIPIVGPGTPDCELNGVSTGQTDGCFKGWAMFHVVSAQGGSSKTITGYFTGDFVGQPLTVGECTAQQQQAGTCGEITNNSPFANNDVRLTD